MTIELNQIACDSNGRLHAKKSLCQIITAKINTAQLNVTKVDFLGQDETLGSLVFRLKISHHGNLSLLDNFYTSFGLLANAVITRHSDDGQSSEILLKTPEQIIKLFNDLGYEDLLNNDLFCLAHQVDLLQALIADSIHELIVQSQISVHAPELIAFNSAGGLSAIVISPNKIKYKLDNIDEISSFLIQYCKFQLPDNFIKLIRSQAAINAKREVLYLHSINEDGLPLLCSQNKLSALKINPSKKQLSTLLERGDSYSEPLTNQERQMFQAYLTEALGDRFDIKWSRNGQDYRLIIACATPTPGFNEQDIERLKEILQSKKLLTAEQVINIEFETLLGAPLPRTYAMSESIEEILTCKITYDLPDGTPKITPQGSSYNSASIMQQIEFHANDPVTRASLAQASLRDNKLLERLIEFYKNPPSGAGDLNIIAPALLRNPQTNEFYYSPVVNADGETVENNIVLGGVDYPNRCISNLIEHYKTTLVMRAEPVIRSQIRATIAANIGLLCPGDGALLEIDAKNEAEYLLPHVEYNALTTSLDIYFASVAYASRFEIELRRWQEANSSASFTADNTTKVDGRVSKNTLKSDGTPLERQFHSRISIQGDDLITVLFKTFCGLAPEYLLKLKALDSLSQMDDLNDLVQVTALASWDQQRAGRNQYMHYEPAQAQREVSILSVRATSDQQRMHSSTYGNASSAATAAGVEDSALAEDMTDVVASVTRLRSDGIRAASQTQPVMTQEATFAGTLSEDSDDEDLFSRARPYETMSSLLASSSTIPASDVFGWGHAARSLEQELLDAWDEEDLFAGIAAPSSAFQRNTRQRIEAGSSSSSSAASATTHANNASSFLPPVPPPILRSSNHQASNSRAQGVRFFDAPLAPIAELPSEEADTTDQLNVGTDSGSEPMALANSSSQEDSAPNGDGSMNNAPG